MSPPSQHDPRGPIEDLEWPTTLEAHVVEPGPRPRVHGYDVQDDLARNYRFGEVALTALRGEVPSEAIGRLFETVLCFLSPCSAGDAPGHAALLVRACGARTPAVLAGGAVALSEEAAAIVDEHRDLLAWLEEPTAELPRAHVCRSESERQAVRRFEASVHACGERLGVLEHDPTLVAALLAAAYHCGARDAERLQAVWLLARLPTVMAEGLHHDPASLRRYPIDLPHFHYVPPPRIEDE